MDQPGPMPEAADELDPAVEARVRELLAAAPDPGPMPEHVAQRIESLLTDEVALRVDPGPLTESDHDQAVIAPLIRQRQRPRTVLAVAAVAAAAAVVAIGGSALHLNKRANGTASLGNPSVTVTPGATVADADRLARAHGVHWDAGGPVQAQLPHPALGDGLHRGRPRGPGQGDALTPDAPIQVLAAEAPTLGPIATEVGLESCLTAHSLPTDAPVHVDIANYEGEPAAIIVVTEGGRSTVRGTEGGTAGDPTPDRRHTRPLSPSTPCRRRCARLRAQRGPRDVPHRECRAPRIG